MLTKRQFLMSTVPAAAIAVGLGMVLTSRGSFAQATFEVTKTEAEWRRLLSDEAYDVLRRQGTEYPYSSPLNSEHRVGVFHCAGCDLALYSSETKFESGTGWPSFWDALPNSVGYEEDRAFGMLRTEIHCSRCGGHQGHLFNDGPPPTGMRHCINGVSLTFKPSPAA